MNTEYAGPNTQYPTPNTQGAASGPHGTMSGPLLLERLAALIDYPDEQIGAHLEACQGDLNRILPEAQASLAEWQGFLDQNPLWAVQELYTQSFEINPICPLDIGYYLFGEDYQRGLFLAQLRESQEEVGLTDEVELPDHLPVLLRWLARVYGSDLHTDMAAECLVPVLRRMDESLSPAGSPYRSVLHAITLVLERDLSERGIAVRVDDARGAAFRRPPGDLSEIPILSTTAPSCGARPGIDEEVGGLL
jgi:nitrate reductase molybdenum cofactor assembly chaperone NarJ/NarW